MRSYVFSDGHVSVKKVKFRRLCQFFAAKKKTLAAAFTVTACKKIICLRFFFTLHIV